MNHKFWEELKSKVMCATYQDWGHAKETPSEYYIQKKELLKLTDSHQRRKELIHAITAVAINTGILSDNKAAHDSEPACCLATTDSNTKDSLSTEMAEGQTEVPELQATMRNACTAFYEKPALNQRTCRALAQAVDKAMEAVVGVNGIKMNTMKVTIDSGSDITLISEDTLHGLLPTPHIHEGQWVNLIQVTGSLRISSTEDGPVKVNIDTYMVKGMMTPLILGNDFTDQYSISIIRHKGKSFLSFGNIERETAVIPPEACVKVLVEVLTLKDSDSWFVEKEIQQDGNAQHIFSSPDSLINSSNPFLHISNFSNTPVVILKGQILGHAHNLKNWLDRLKEGNTILRETEAYACFVKSLVGSHGTSDGEGVAQVIQSEAQITSKAQWNATEVNDLVAQPLVEGGLKSAETPPEPIIVEWLLNELDLSPDITEDQCKELHNTILANQLAFRLDGQLGMNNAHVEVNLVPGSQPVSLPLFPASPANWAVMDKQIDSWIQLDVIEPSQSPWAAPAFIVYRNGKPWMVIDYRKLNAIVIPDEFLLPHQDDIMQSLSGQKVLRLGMSMHSEKVEAIIQLDTPRNVHELQTFLGMMIAHPLFQLLKNIKWEWSSLHDEAFQQGYACDYGLAGILQQVQEIHICNLWGTKLYEWFKKAYENKENIPQVIELRTLKIPQFMLNVLSVIGPAF
ncbi:hypothetical protein EDD85DRAFT_792777 [Armillaria nabsnona]|nr:hypothetical protein EDD85DRAFT_792777 [Armillaria nabsnona]